MNTNELSSILTNAIGYEITDIRTISDKTVTSSKELFDPALYSYSGLAKIQDTFEIVWSLTQDEGSDWYVSYEDVAST